MTKLTCPHAREQEYHDDSPVPRPVFDIRAARCLSRQELLYLFERGDVMLYLRRLRQRGVRDGLRLKQAVRDRPLKQAMQDAEILYDGIVPAPRIVQKLLVGYNSQCRKFRSRALAVFRSEERRVGKEV